MLKQAVLPGAGLVLWAETDTGVIVIPGIEDDYGFK